LCRKDAATGSHHLPGRNDSPGRIGVPRAASATSASAGNLPRRNDGSGWHYLPAATTAATAAAAAAARR